MNKYFNQIDILPVLDKGSVELWSGWNSNINEESRIETVTTVASASYGNEYAKNPKSLWERLQKEGHESVQEFIRWGGEHWEWMTIQGSLRHQQLKTYAEYTLGGQVDREIVSHQNTIATFKIKMPITMARQIMTHRVSKLELSRRYTKNAKVPYTFYFFNRPDDMEALELLSAFYARAVELESKLIGLGYKQEDARMVIPPAVYTTVWMMFDKDQLANFFKLRLDSHTQGQTQEYARAMYELCEKYQPEILKGA